MCAICRSSKKESTPFSNWAAVISSEWWVRGSEAAELPHIPLVSWLPLALPLHSPSRVIFVEIPLAVCLCGEPSRSFFHDKRGSVSTAPSRYDVVCR